MTNLDARLNATDRRLVQLTQAGLPLVAHPYRVIAEQAGIDEAEVIARLAALQDAGVIRRIAAVPNHYALGYVANGMTVWDVADEVVSEVGREMAALEYVTHAYRRPRHLPVWPYNLFCMVHGKTRDEVMVHVEEMTRLMGPAQRGHDVLFSTRILKKTGLRIAA